MNNQWYFIQTYTFYISIQANDWINNHLNKVIQ